MGLTQEQSNLINKNFIINTFFLHFLFFTSSIISTSAFSFVERNLATNQSDTLKGIVIVAVLKLLSLLLIFYFLWECIDVFLPD